MLQSVGWLSRACVGGCDGFDGMTREGRARGDAGGGSGEFCEEGDRRGH